jgi:hypothetical protein
VLGEISTENHVKQPAWYADAFRISKEKPKIGAVIISDVYETAYTHGYNPSLTPQTKNTLKEVFKDPYWILAQ